MSQEEEKKEQFEEAEAEEEEEEEEEVCTTRKNGDGPCGLLMSKKKKKRRRRSYAVCWSCRVSGDGVSLLTASVLFGTIAAVQYSFAVAVKSVALQADCVSMAVDSLSFLGNLAADSATCLQPRRKRALELGMSGASHLLLLGFTASFLQSALKGLLDDEDDDQSPGGRRRQGWTVFAFALAGLFFDLVSLAAYYLFGDKKHALASLEDYRVLEGEEEEEEEESDELTCGVNTNVCAALLHVVSDLARSTTTLAESILILNVDSISATRLDSVAALAVCSIIAVGATAALFAWSRELKVFLGTRSGGGLRGLLRIISLLWYLELFGDKEHGESRRSDDEVDVDHPETTTGYTSDEHLDPDNNVRTTFADLPDH